MATIDSSIPLGVKPVELPNPLAQFAQMAQIQGAQQQNALLGLQMQKAQREESDLQALRSGLSEPGADPYKVLLGQGRVKEAGDYLKSQREADKAKVELVGAKLAQSKQYLDSVTTPDQFIQWHQANHADPILGPELAARGVTPEKSMAAIQEALGKPGGFQEILGKARLGLDKYIELNKPTTTVVNAGGTSQVLQTPGLGGAPQTVATVEHTQTPESKAIIAKDYAVAGLNPDGTPGGDIETTARAIATGNLPPPSGMALTNPKNQRILSRVMEINPEYDYTTVTAKKKAASDFTTGTLGNSMRSFAVAGQHLDQLGQLVDALNNGNMQLVNKIGNAYSQQTGSPAVTNFDAAKDVVSKEVVKAIVAGGGGVAEREELSRLMDSAKSPAQLKGVIQQYRNLMAAQHDALLQQRRAAGLPDSTLPNYAGAEGAGRATAGGVPLVNAKGWTLHTDAKGNRAYVSPDGKQFEALK